jgi:hypothetical protein
MRNASYKHRQAEVNGGTLIYLGLDFDSVDRTQEFSIRSPFSLTALKEE